MGSGALVGVYTNAFSAQIIDALVFNAAMLARATALVFVPRRTLAANTDAAVTRIAHLRRCTYGARVLFWQANIEDIGTVLI